MPRKRKLPPELEGLVPVLTTYARRMLSRGVPENSVYLEEADDWVWECFRLAKPYEDWKVPCFSTDREDFLVNVNFNNNVGMLFGQRQGWWDSIDERGNPVPFPIVIKIRYLEHKTMAHAFFKAGIFDSISDAKRAGWKDKPAVPGEHWFNKRTKRVQLV